MAQTGGPEPPKRGMHRTVTGSHMDLSEMENLIAGASTRGQETETSSLASSSQTGRSNIIQVGTMENACIKGVCSFSIVKVYEHGHDV